MDRAKRREYQNRQKYRRVPLDDARWKALGRQAKAKGGVTRTGLAAAYLRSAIDSGGEGVNITPRVKDWKHAQAKEHDGSDAQRASAEQRAIEDYLRDERERRWRASGANLLNGPNVVRRDLEE